MVLEYKQFQLGYLATNCYLLLDAELRCAALIDPGAYSERIASLIEESNVELEYILITHGHFDHVGGLLEFHRRFPNSLIVMSKEDVELYKHAPLMANSFGLDLL